MTRSKRASNEWRATGAVCLALALVFVGQADASEYLRGSTTEAVPPQTSFQSRFDMGPRTRYASELLPPGVSPEYSPQVGFVRERQTVQHVVVIVNKSRTVRVERPFAKTIVASPDIADVLPMSNQTIYIQGKKIGTTNVSIFDENARMIEVLDLEVTCSRKFGRQPAARVFVCPR